MLKYKYHLDFLCHQVQGRSIKQVKMTGIESKCKTLQDFMVTLTPSIGKICHWQLGDKFYEIPSGHWHSGILMLFNS